MKLHRRSKNNKKPVLRQILDLVPTFILRNSIGKYGTDKGCHKYKTYDQFVALSFGQLKKCYTLSDISCGLSISSTYMTDLGIKQNLQIKTFLGTNENAVKSQIYVAMIVFLLLELIRRVYCRQKRAFSNFCEKIRICMLHYLSLLGICAA